MGLMEGTERRPADLLVAEGVGNAGKSLAIDVTVIRLQTATSRDAAARAPGLVLQQAEEEKYRGAAGLRGDVDFTAFACDDYGALGGQVHALLDIFARRAEREGRTSFTDGATVGQRRAALRQRWARRVRAAVRAGTGWAQEKRIANSCRRK
jgi:hypothetical protein